MAGNPFYTPTGAPGTGAEGLSAQMRTEFRLIGAGFDLLPRISTTGQFGTTFIQTGSYTFTLPGRGGTIALLDDVTQEAARAGAAETALSTSLASLGASSASAIAAETARAQAAESVLTTAITGETQQRVSAVASERADRIAAIAGLSSGSSATIGGVSAAITQEVADRMAADGALTTRLSNAELATSAEATRATSAESTISSALNAEVTRARAAEVAATASVATERTRALQAEAGLQPALGFVPYNATNPADYVTGARLNSSLGAYPTNAAVSSYYAAIGYVNSTFAPLTDGNGWPVARQYSDATFNRLYPQIVQTQGSRVASAGGYQLNPGGLSSGNFSGMSISVDANGNGMLAFSYMATSDGRLKSDRTLITAEEGERFVRMCPAYRYVKNGNPEAGFIAQDLGAAGFGDTLNAWDAGKIQVPDEAFGYTGPKDKYLIMPDKTPTAYLAAALASALTKIEALTLKVEQLSAGK